MQNAKLYNYLHLHFIVFIWGFTAVLGALISLDAIPLVWYRMGLATLLIAIFVAITKKKVAFPKKTIIAFFIGGLIIALHWLTFFGAIKEANVSIALSVMSTGAFFTAILEPIYFKRKVIWYELAFGLVVIVGLYLIFISDGSYGYGMLLALISAFLSALFSVINGKFAQQYDASVISMYELFFGVTCISVYVLVTNGFNVEFFTVSATDWMYLAILASACTAYAFIASIHVMKWLSPYTVMLTINLEPVYGIILALFVLQDAEYMRPQFYYGALIIIATVIANGIIKTRAQRKSKTNRLS